MYLIIKDRLKDLIRSASDISGLFNCLNEAQRAELYPLVQHRLNDLIKNAVDLLGIANPLNQAERTLLFMLIQDRLNDLIISDRELTYLLPLFNPSERQMIYLAIKDRLRDFHISTGSLLALLDSLNETQRAELLLEVGECLPRLKVWSCTELLDLSRFLSSEQFTMVLMSNTSQLVHFYLSGQLARLNPMQSLNEMQRLAVFTALSNSIHSSSDLLKLLQHLDKTQRTELLLAMGERLPQLTVSSSEELLALSQFLNPDQRTSVLLVNKSKLLNLFSSEGLGRFNPLQSLDEMQRLAVFTALSNSIHSSSVLLKLLQRLDETQRTELLRAIEERLPQLTVSSSEELAALSEFLNPTQRRAVYSALSESIKSTDELLTLLTSLPEPEHAEFLVAATHQLPHLITNAYDLFAMLSKLDSGTAEHTVKKSKTLLAIIPLTTWIKDRYDMQDFLGGADETRSPMIIDAIQNELLALLHNRVDLEEVLPFLNRAERQIVLTSVFERTELLQNADDVLAVLTYVDRSQREALLKTIAPTLLLAILKDEKGLFQLKNTISPDYYQALVTQQYRNKMEAGRSDDNSANSTAIPGNKKTV